MKIARALIVLLPAIAQADDWTVADTAHEIAFASIAAVDYAQTAAFLSDARFREDNPLLGAHPGRTKLRLMVGTGVLAHAVMARTLPQPWRRYWQVILIGIEAGVVSSNASMVGGIRLSW
jgi:hypothetical protein